MGYLASVLGYLVDKFGRGVVKSGIIIAMQSVKWLVVIAFYSSLLGVFGLIFSLIQQITLFLSVVDADYYINLAYFYKVFIMFGKKKNLETFEYQGDVLVQVEDSRNTVSRFVGAVVGAVVVGSSNAFAGALTADAVFDLGDVNFIFGGMVVAGIALYAIKKAKSLLGA